MKQLQLTTTLWDTMGVTSEIQQLGSDLISGKSKTALISGPPGSGKTWITRYIADSFAKSGGISFRGVGDEGEANRHLYTMLRVQAETTGYFSPLATLGKSVAKGAVHLASVGLIDGRGAIEAAEQYAARKKRSGLFLTEDEQSILFDIAKDAGERPVLLVADNLHWWDKGSLALLRSMLKGMASKAYPFIDTLRIIAVTTDDTYQRPVWCEEYEKHTLPLFGRAIQTRYFNKEELSEVAPSLGLPEQVTSQDREFIFDISGGHLSILTGACSFLAENGATLTSLRERDESRFIEDLFLERLRKIGALGGVSERLLIAASLVGNNALRDELECLLSDDCEQVGAAIEICRKLNFIDESEDQIEFRHDFIKKYFVSRLKDREIQLRKTFAECLRSLTPGDYIRRAENFMRFKNHKEASPLFVAAVTENLRNGRSWDDSICIEGLKQMRHFGYDDLAKDFSKAYQHLACGENIEASYIIEGLGQAYPSVILAEIEFIRSLIELNLRSNSRRQRLIVRLEGWTEHIDREFEQGLRLQIILRSALVLNRDKSKARAIDEKIVRSLSNRINFDKKAESLIHAIGRSAESLLLPDIAINRVRKAVKYHEPDAGLPPREPSEYFRCLNNLTALHIANGEYGRAVKEAGKAIELADCFEGMIFPRRDMVHTLDIMARFRMKSINVKSAIKMQTRVIENYGVASDPYYIKNHLAVYYCLNGDLQKGQTLFQRLREQLLEIGDPEPNPLYFVSANMCCAQYLAGENAQNCLCQWQELEVLVDNNPYEIRQMLQKRHKLIENTFKQGLRMSPVEWDVYSIQADHYPSSHCWQEIGRGFRMPDVQFWSMF